MNSLTKWSTSLLSKSSPPKMCVASSGLEGVAAEIEDEDVLLHVVSVVKTVSKSSSGGLVDDTESIESTNGVSVLGCLTLTVIEESRKSDESVFHGASQISFCMEDISPAKNLFNSTSACHALDNRKLATNESNTVLEGLLVLRSLADEPLRIGESGMGRSGSVASIIVSGNYFY